MDSSCFRLLARSGNGRPCSDDFPTHPDKGAGLVGFVSRRPTAASAKSCHLPDARRGVRARAFCGSVGGRGHAEPRPPGLSQPFGSYLSITMQLVRDPRKRKVAWLIVPLLREVKTRWRGESSRGPGGPPDLEGACRVSRPNWQQHVCVIRAQTTAHGDLSRQTGRPSNARADRRQHAVRDVAANEY